LMSSIKQNWASMYARSKNRAMCFIKVALMSKCQFDFLVSTQKVIDVKEICFYRY